MGEVGDNYIYTGSSAGRTIWFILNQVGVADSQELFIRLTRLINTWETVYSDDGGNVTYKVRCDQEHFEELRRLFNENEFKGVWGVIMSGVVENGQFRGWPRKSKQITSTPTPTSKKDMFEWLRKALRWLIKPPD